MSIFMVGNNREEGGYWLSDEISYDLETTKPRTKYEAFK